MLSAWPVSQLTFTLAAPCGRLGHGIRLGMAVPHVEALAFTSMLARRRLLLPALGESVPRLVPPRRAAPLLRSLGDIEPRTRSAQGARRHKSPQRLQHVRLAEVWPGSDWGSGPGLALALARHGQCPLAGQQQNKTAVCSFLFRPATCALSLILSPFHILPLLPSPFLPFSPLCSSLFSTSTKFAQHKLCFVRMFF